MRMVAWADINDSNQLGRVRQPCGCSTHAMQLFVSESRFGFRAEGGRRPVPEQPMGAFADITFAASYFFAALVQVVVSDSLQVVDVVEIHVFEKVYFWVDVARDGDVNQEQRRI